MPVIDAMNTQPALLTEPPPLQPTTASSVARFWPTFMRARMAVATVLLSLQVIVLMLGTTHPWNGLLISAVHLAATIAAGVLLPGDLKQERSWPWTLTVGVDLVMFAALQLQQQASLNYTLLFALPILMSAILGPQRRALGTAALVTLFLLGDAWWASFVATEDSAPRFFQTAITGTAFFLVALLARQLATRLASEEALSHSSQLAARTHALVNEVVIESMSDGVAVVDMQGFVRTANPAARHMLGDATGAAPASFLLSDRPYCHMLNDLVTATFEQHAPQTSEVQLEPHPEMKRRLRVRSKLTHTDDRDATPGNPGLCVLFLEDLHELEARVRTEKLAGMGRMSLAVAHEIRNPLSAISQANGLLLEDLTDPQHQRLASMVATHTQRLNRIVDDVLNVARVPGQLAPPDTTPVQLDACVANTMDEWCSQHSCSTRVQWRGGCASLQVRFDPEHLRRVLVNLLDNASRYASQSPGSIQISSRQESAHTLRLSVWSDGLALDQSVRRHLFEPFFSSESRSSGMGLYLCRELCERYRAHLSYQRSEREGHSGNDFFLLIPIANPI